MIKTWRPAAFQLELLRCYKFCYSITNDTVYTISLVNSWGIAVTTAGLSNYINLPVPMHTLPTFSVKGVAFMSGFIVLDAVTTFRPTTMFIVGYASRLDHFRLTVLVSGTPLTQFRGYSTRLNNFSGTIVCLDAGL